MGKRAQLLLCIFWLLLLPVASSVPAQDARPKRHPDFREGYRAYEYKNWQRTADSMWKACANWPEDGEPVITSGNWPAPYLPRYYLGVALFHLGCYKEALDQFESSVLSQHSVDGAEEESETLRSLKRKCEAFLEYEGEEDAEVDCSKWHIDTEQEPAVITDRPSEPGLTTDDPH